MILSHCHICFIILDIASIKDSQSQELARLYFYILVVNNSTIIERQKVYLCSECQSPGGRAPALGSLDPVSRTEVLLYAGPGFSHVMRCGKQSLFVLSWHTQSVIGAAESAALGKHRTFVPAGNRGHGGLSVCGHVLLSGGMGTP